MKRCIVPENTKLIVAKRVNIPDIACVEAGKGREQDSGSFHCVLRLDYFRCIEIL